MKKKKYVRLLTKLRYELVESSESVVVLAGGMSVLLDKNKINNYIFKNNSIVISANHSYDFIDKIDYTFFGDPDVFLSKYTSIRGTPIISVRVKDRLKDRINNMFWNRFIKKKKVCFEVFTRGKKHGNKMKKWKINKDGTFPTLKYSSTGFAAMCISLLFRPKEVLVAGLDGPEFDTPKEKRGSKLPKFDFNGRMKKYKSVRDSIEKKNVLEFKVIPLLQSKNVNIVCVPSSKLYGIDKKKYNIVLL